MMGGHPAPTDRRTSRMAVVEPAFRLGIEEEYLLVNPVSRDLEVDPPAALLDACEQRLEGHVSPEIMRCQIEVGTPVCRSVDVARNEPAYLRDGVSGGVRQ